MNTNAKGLKMATRSVHYYKCDICEKETEEKDGFSSAALHFEGYVFGRYDICRDCLREHCSEASSSGGSKIDWKKLFTFIFKRGKEKGGIIQ